MSTQPKPRLTPEEYLEIERKAEFKSEFYDGEMYAMSGAREAHATVVTNLSNALTTPLRRRCRVFTNEMRVLVSPTGLYTYPDVVVVCGERKYLDGELDTLMNPTILMEVLSPSTESYDREKSSTIIARSIRCASTCWFRLTARTSTASSAQRATGHFRQPKDSSPN